MNTPIFAIIWVSHPVWWTYVNRHDLFRHTRCLSRSDSRRYKKVKNLDFLMLWCRFSQSYEVYLEHEICMAWICRLTWCLSACLTFKVQNLDLWWNGTHFNRQVDNWSLLTLVELVWLRMHALMERKIYFVVLVTLFRLQREHNIKQCTGFLSFSSLSKFMWFQWKLKPENLENLFSIRVV